jgi:hypothetical protein
MLSRGRDSAIRVAAAEETFRSLAPVQRRRGLSLWITRERIGANPESEKPTGTQALVAMARLGLVVAAGLLFGAVAMAAPGRESRSVQVRVGELVQIAGTRVYCRAESAKDPRAGPLMECFETRDGWRGSYEVGISERFVWIERHLDANHVRVVLTRQQHR